MVIDCHYHLEERMLGVPQMIARMDAAGIDIDSEVRTRTFFATSADAGAAQRTDRPTTARR